MRAATRLAGTAPYAVLLGLAAYLFQEAGQLEITRIEGRLGPDFWPKAILVLLMATCAYELLRRLLRGSDARPAEPVTLGEDATVDELEPDAAPARRYPHLLWIGAGITVAYVALLDVLGFFLATFLYTLLFMLVGRYRRWPVLIASSLGGSLLFMFVFMKVVYISLPIGREPFSAVSVALMQLMGIR
ncbi:MAG: tripartite tricarboxylate transporter TctB family protein [Betaproteobacteria bacterium]|nr:tripartite tricarboxylate transporter TctB family protein [Betaproteobacteria bacterium]